MNATLQRILDRASRPPVKKYIVHGWASSPDGGRDWDYMHAWGRDEKEAMEQALRNSAGTKFTPKRIELAED